tara:strand:+ start:510 stop:785 length:276 start_codon:yes stop_codon:yes gene_type:complete
MFFIFTIFAIKIGFVTMGILNIFFKRHHDPDPDVKKWHQFFDSLFKISTAILIIILFNPWYPRLEEVNREVLIILTVFAIITMVDTKNPFE